jgi:hypothetical protein
MRAQGRREVRTGLSQARLSRIGRGLSVMTFAITAWAVLPVCGGSPVSIS